MFYKTYTLTTQPFYDRVCQCYKNIVMINVVPDGPLKQLVMRTQLPPLSPFQQSTPCNPIPTCGLALISLKGLSFGCNSCSTNYMTPDEIPDLFGFLTMNGYNINTSVTHMMNTSDVKLTSRRIICFINYMGNQNNPFNMPPEMMDTI